MTDKVFFLTHILHIIPDAGKPQRKHIHFEQYAHAYLALLFLLYLTCRKLTSRIDSNYVLRKPSCYILRHKSFKVYLISISFLTLCDRNHLRHCQVHWKKSRMKSHVNVTHTKIHFVPFDLIMHSNGAYLQGELGSSL